MEVENLKVAIIGAGVAGLSCAHELERFGLSPVIYERNSFIGETHPHVSAILEIIHRPIKDSVQYFKKELNLDIKPLNTVNSIVHHSPKKVREIRGNFGYFFNRSREPHDIKKQLYSQLKKTQIMFNEYGDYQKLMQKYDKVVIANGTTNFTQELGCWTEWVNTYLRGAIVLGDFDPNTLLVWIDKSYCKSGYAYLTPFDRNRASMALIVTDVGEREIDNYWELFLDSENIKYTIVEEYKLNHKSGYVYPHQSGSIYLAGDSAGVIEPFLGFGQMSSIISGVMAARSIVDGKDYEKLIKPLARNNLRFHEFRKGFDLLGNNGYDILMSVMGWPGVKHVLYYSPFNAVKYGSYLMRLVPKNKTKKK
jgi:digeranylgeranylglycerophospholipid reductase